jgi:predicted RNase H-like HicB family nuclease
MMLTQYIQAAMAHAAYEMLPDQTFYGEIPGLAGVYANANTLESCRGQLQEVLEGWIVLGLRMNHTLPAVDGIKLDIGAEVA